MRLDKFIAHCTGASRSEVKRWIRAKCVTVAGITTTDPRHYIAPPDEVTLNGSPLAYPHARYYMLHKPEGVVCSNEDGEHPTALDCLTGIHREGLQIAGRLDKDTTGLVLITDDGQWNHTITAPRAAKNKVYCVSLAKPISAQCMAQFAEGILLKGESKPTRPANVAPITDTKVRVTLHEGRYHQVKRMFAACGNHVTALHRESVAGIVLDAALAPGQFRPLTQAEINLSKSTSTDE
ncbi:pseudouridine synthase [Gilvimarinus agarilyticus]|uniref:pseudouridine synthase n=1 Tax=Gilvimarinus agarilyticus TaxID=679259 RepID=UPI00059F2534|nr:pseudouridine synthase [Gilvimarinus agarilyticus]